MKKTIAIAIFATTILVGNSFADWDYEALKRRNEEQEKKDKENREKETQQIIGAAAGTAAYIAVDAYKTAKKNNEEAMQRQECMSQCKSDYKTCTSMVRAKRWEDPEEGNQAMFRCSDEETSCRGSCK